MHVQSCSVVKPIAFLRPQRGFPNIVLKKKWTFTSIERELPVSTPYESLLKYNIHLPLHKKLLSLCLVSFTSLEAFELFYHTTVCSSSFCRPSHPFKFNVFLSAPEVLRKVVEGRFQNLVLHFVHISTSLTKFILINTITMSVLVKGPVKKYRGRGGGFV